MPPLPAHSDPYTGLRKAEPTLPSAAYFDRDWFDREQDAIWRRSWVAVCRASEVAGALSYRVFRLGTQEIVVLRDEAGVLRAFHNTCRHRGSALCLEDEGRLRSRLLVCPYHAWSYSLRGDLVRVPSKSLPPGFDKSEYGLYPVAIEEWRGFIFINLAKDPGRSAAEEFDLESADLGNWPLEGLVIGHGYWRTLRCNWKIFWENFNECLHCPSVHPELSKLVPIYGRGMMVRHDDPEWARHADNDAPEFSGRLREGAETWSLDGNTHAPAFQGLTAAERTAGQSYAVHLPSMFIVGHVDYVRTVRLRPLGPEETELTAEWLFAPEALTGGEAPEEIIAFGKLVLDQDAAVCEINQRGLKSMRHKAGVLMPEEYELSRFHRWVRDRMPSDGAA